MQNNQKWSVSHRVQAFLGMQCKGKWLIFYGLFLMDLWLVFYRYAKLLHTPYEKQAIKKFADCTRTDRKKQAINNMSKNHCTLWKTSHFRLHAILLAFWNVLWLVFDRGFLFYACGYTFFILINIIITVLCYI